MDDAAGTSRILTINIKSSQIKQKKEKKESVVSLEGFVQVKYKYLVHLHNSWIRYTRLEDGEIKVHQGGFLVKTDLGTSVKIVYLRIPAKNETLELIVDNDTLFYVKSDNLNYNAIKNFIYEFEKLKHDYNELKNKS